MKAASSVTDAYARAQGLIGSSASSESGDAVSDFGDVLKNSIQNVIDTSHQADAQATEGMSNGGSLTDIVTAVSRAQLALQTTTVIRDRIVEAYQDIMKMSI